MAPQGDIIKVARHTRFIRLSAPKQDFPATVVAPTKAKNMRWLSSRAVNLS
jgi:hypothetical protein